MPIRSVSSVASSAATFTCPAPSSVSPGDQLVAFQMTDGVGTSTPSGGWKLLTSPGVFDPDFLLSADVWVRTAQTGDAASYTFTRGSGSSSVVAIAAVSGVSSATPRTEFNDGRDRSNILTLGVNLPAGTGTELRFVGGSSLAANTASWSAPPGFVMRANRRSGNTSGALGTRQIATPGDTGQATFTASATLQAILGVTVLFTDQASGGGDTPPVPPPTVPALPSSERLIHYTYEFADLLTDALICKDLDLRDVSYERRIGEAGAFSASLDVNDPVSAAKVARIVPRHPEDLSTGPGRSIVHIYRNGVVWGSYVIWTASVSRSGKGPITVSLQGSSLESYLSHVKVRADYEYAGTDQIDIARGLITGMQSTPRYNIGLELQDGTSSVIRDRVYLASEASTYGERLSELAAVDGGFEWAIQTVDNGDGTRTRVWTWGYPKLGDQATAHKFMEPGNILSWQEDIDPLRGGTAFQTRGESINDDASITSEPLVSNVVLAQAHIDAGWPGLDVTTDYSSVSNVATLNAYAQWWATNRGGAVRVHQATVRLPANTSFGPGNLGDTVTLMLANDWWPIVNGAASFAKTWRVVGMVFKPPQKGSGQEECAITFEELMEA